MEQPWNKFLMKTLWDIWLIAHPLARFQTDLTAHLPGPTYSTCLAANCFCPRMYHQFIVQTNKTLHHYATCVRYDIEYKSWTNAKFSCQNLNRNGYLATEFSTEKHEFNRSELEQCYFRNLFAIPDLFESLASQSEPYKYHIGLHFINQGYFWEQPVGFPLVPLSQSLYPLDPKPASTIQCVSNYENTESKEEQWQNVNCFNEFRPYLCEVAACDTENFCAWSRHQWTFQ